MVPQTKDTKMTFTMDNTSGFTQADLDLMNAAVIKLIEETGMDEKSASDIVNNNWTNEDNTIACLSAFHPHIPPIVCCHFPE